MLVGKNLQFIAKGYGYGENGVKDGDPDPKTYAPAGDDVGPVDISVTWTTSVAQDVGSIDENTGLFQAGEEAGEGTVTAKYIRPSDKKELTDEVEVAVLEIKEFLIRDAWNFWNFSKHIPADNEYWDHKQEVGGVKRQVIVAADMATDSAWVRLEIATKPAGLEDKISWLASSPQVSPQTGDFTVSGKASVTIRSAGTGQETYQVYVGVDSNQDGELDLNNEVGSVNTVRLLTRAHLKSNYTVAISGTKYNDWRGWNVASTHAYIFLDQPEEADVPFETKEGVEISRTEKGIGYELTHPVGADFDVATGIAKIEQKRFAPDSETAQKIAHSPELRELIEEDLKANKGDVEEFFKRNPNTKSKVFKFEHGPSQIEFVVDPNNDTDDDEDLNAGFGTAKIEYALYLKVNKDLTIDWANLLHGEVTDLYDWDAYDNYWGARLFATLQFAWESPPYKKAGRIFWVYVKFKAMKIEDLEFPPDE